jgi:biopolymer transport protein ExbB
MQSSLGFAHFLAQADGVARAILFVMLAMSIATWYLIVTKSLRNLFERRASAGFLKAFWDAPDLGAVAARLSGAAPDEPFARLVRHGLRAVEQHRTRGAQRLVEAGSADDFLTRSLRRAIEETTARAESGLTVLASIGSSAPFIGLFGTVWGIYHALIAIGVSGQGTLDKVAGPVGEALIMTALGLAVAIPAVLAYNAFTRRNRVVLAELDAFAHDVFTFMSTGHRVDPALDAAAGGATAAGTRIAPAGAGAPEAA